ncbi:hypothetical protein LA080_012772 [Diaporthe eres]|nr:hypothetical protein LA080_012772 [Diaporthe eres]
MWTPKSLLLTNWAKCDLNFRAACIFCKFRRQAQRSKPLEQPATRAPEPTAEQAPEPTPDTPSPLCYRLFVTKSNPFPKSITLPIYLPPTGVAVQENSDTIVPGRDGMWFPVNRLTYVNAFLITSDFPTSKFVIQGKRWTSHSSRRWQRNVPESDQDRDSHALDAHAESVVYCRLKDKGCKTFFLRRAVELQHFKIVHTDEAWTCPIEECDEVFTSPPSPSEPSYGVLSPRYRIQQMSSTEM